MSLYKLSRVHRARPSTPPGQIVLHTSQNTVSFLITSDSEAKRNRESSRINDKRLRNQNLNKHTWILAFTGMDGEENLRTRFFIWYFAEDAENQQIDLIYDESSIRLHCLVSIEFIERGGPWGLSDRRSGG